MKKALSIVVVLVIIVVISLSYLITGFGQTKTFTSEKYGLQIDIPVTWNVEEATEKDYPNVLSAEPRWLGLYNEFAFWAGLSVSKDILYYPKNEKHPVYNLSDMKKEIQLRSSLSTDKNATVAEKEENGLKYLLEKRSDGKQISYFITPTGTYQYLFGDIKDLNLKIK